MRILIAEDEPGNLEELERIILADEPTAEVFGFINPFEALAAIRSQTFDAALLDIQMPGMTGLDLAEQISAIQPELPFVFITAYNYYATEAFELNAMDYILKPVRPDRLQKVLAKIRSTERRAKSQENFIKMQSIRTFGGLRVISDYGEIRWDRTKTAELFAFLLMKKGARVHKEQLCLELWPNLDEQRALANLQVTICRLRKILSAFDRAQVCINFVNHFYTMTLEDVQYDAEQFDQLALSNDVTALRQAADLYVGEYFEPEGWLWAESKRMVYRQKHLHIVWSLAGYYRKKNDYLNAEVLLRGFVIACEPNDNISQLFLTVSAEQGGTPALSRAYKLLRERYDKSSGIAVPGPVQQEYQRLRGER